MGDDWRGKPFYFEDYCVGESQLTESHTVTEQEIIDYARRWDPQPFHLDEEAGRASPMGGLSASSCHTYSISSLIYSRSDEKLHTAAMLGLQMRFPNPVRPDEELTLFEKFTDKRVSKSRPAFGVVSSESVIRNERGEDVMVMTSSYLVARREGQATD